MANWNWKVRTWGEKSPREQQWQETACGTPRAFGASKEEWLSTPFHFCAGTRIWHSWEDFKEAREEPERTSRATQVEQPLALEEVR